MTDKEFGEFEILIVDDEPVNVEVLEDILEAAGYGHVISTTDPFEAVRLYGERSFDIVLLDLLMPGMDGFEVLEKFKATKYDPPVPVLVLTALRDRETRLKALRRGARDFITKPFDHQEVLARIHNLLEVRLAQKQLKSHNIILDQKVRERTQEIHETRLEIIRRLGIAAEYRDNETGLHIIRMSLYSQLLGKAAGMSDSEAEMLLQTSPMHDIGKIGIPDSILLKPGKLNREEWEIMQTHTTIGAKILADHPSELFQAARTIALTHHEKWNGMGYPYGISGEDIPFVGRIVAVADVFDALTSRRPYKEPWSVEKAVAQLEQDSGKHFDPKLVDSFNEVLPDILKIKDLYDEPQHQEGGYSENRTANIISGRR
jgi:putative two-component system response regulator